MLEQQDNVEESFLPGKHAPFFGNPIREFTSEHENL